MPLTEYAQRALAKLESAELRIQGAREADDDSPENLRRWLGALSDYVLALADIHELDREQLDGNLQRLAQRVGVETQAGHRPPSDASARKRP